MTKSSLFDASQRKLIFRVAKQMRNVGYLWAAAAILGLVLDSIDLIKYLGQVNPINVLDIFKKSIEDRDFFNLFDSIVKQPFYVLIGIVTIRTSLYFQAIAAQEGSDIENLIQGLVELGKVLSWLLTYAVIFITILWLRILLF
jgi:hypothetical protein